MEYVVAVIVAILSMCGTMAGSYFANKKSTALLAYRMEQLEKEVSEQNKQSKHIVEEQTKIIERIHKIELRAEGMAQHIDIIYKKIGTGKAVDIDDVK